MVDFVDLAVRRFKHHGDFGDLWRLLEPGELIGGPGQVGAWGHVDIVTIDMNEFIVEVVVELAWPSLRVKLSLGHRKGSLVCSVLHIVDVPIDVGGVVLLSFPFPRGAIDADVEDCASTEGRERRLFGGGDSLHRALGLGVWILL